MTKRLGDHRYHLPEPHGAFVTDYLTPAEQSRKLDEPQHGIFTWKFVVFVAVMALLLWWAS